MTMTTIVPQKYSPLISSKLEQRDWKQSLFGFYIFIKRKEKVTMDEMKLTSKLMRGVASKIIRKVIKKTFGFDIELVLNNFYISYDDENASVHIDANAKMNRENLETILKEADLL